MDNIVSQEWRKLTRKYQSTKDWYSWLQLALSLLPLILFLVLAYFALQVHFLLMLPFTLCAALFVVRIFIIQHDCGHGSFFKSRTLRDNIGFLCGIITLTPYEHWQWSHSQHHAHSGNLELRDLGEVKMLTAQEYLALSSWGRFKYLFYRNPIIMFLVGPFWLFFVQHRFPNWEALKSEKLRWSVWLNNIALLALFFWISSFIGVVDYLLIHVFTLYFAAVIGVWLFYVQHQFEDGYWRPASEWTAAEAAVEGSSYFKLPRTIQWLTGNIGFHHIHHLNPLIPNYELEACYKENKIFQDTVTTLTLANCWETMKLKFWDEKTQKMLRYHELQKAYIKNN